MRQQEPSPVPYELIAALHQSPGWQFWRTGAHLSALNTIVEQNLWGALPHIAPLLGAKSSDVRAAAARAAADLLGTNLAQKLVYLAPGLGRMVPYEFQSSLQQINRSTAFSLEVSPDTAWAVFGLPSFHSNGWVRETAVERLGEIGDGREIPFLLIRANDWVKVIMDRASGLLEDRIQHRPTAQLLESLTTTYFFRARVRGNLSTLCERLVSRVGMESQPDAMLESANRNPGGFRRWLIREVMLPNIRDFRAPVLGELLRDHDPIIRTAAWETSIRAPSAGATPLVRAALHDNWPALRRRALEELFANSTGDGDGALVAALLDRASSVRGTARFLLEKNSKFNIREFYRAEVAKSAAPPPAALSGLAENGEKADAPTLAEFLNSDKTSLRRTAVAAVGKLAPNEYKREILTALAAPAASVSKAAREVLRYRHSLVSRPLLTSLVLSTDHPLHVRRNALTLVRVLSKWDRILAYLDVLPKADDLRPEVVVEVQRWLQRFNREWEMPSRAVLDKLGAETRGNVEWLGAHVARELESIATSTPAK